MKKLAILATVAVVAGLLATAGTALAGPTHPTWGSFVNAGAVPPGSKLVLNITYKVTNDEDSGFFGYWALDDYNKRIQVWQVSDGSFYAVASYSGKWQTFAGAPSPGSGTLQSKDASGTFEGGWVGTFDAPGYISANGNIGTFDFGGTRADVLVNGGNITPFSALGTYFLGYSNFNYVNWGWTYKYQS